jgi:glycosyltransferase involved in cell wall biosynthesis
VRWCFLIPIFDHDRTIRDVVKSLEPYATRCFIVDDGSGDATAGVLRALESEFEEVLVHRLPDNRGKGAAIVRGLELAAEHGFTHAVTLDADGQHDVRDVPRFLEASRDDPDALVLGQPVFDASVPKARLWGRQLSCGLVRLETLSGAICDPLCGFRSIPVVAALAVLRSARYGRRMEFDPELAVRMVLAGTPVVNVPTLVRYPPGGTSHFRMFRDNARISWFHTRMIASMLLRLPALAARGRAGDA